MKIKQETITNAQANHKQQSAHSSKVKLYFYNWKKDNEITDKNTFVQSLHQKNHQRLFETKNKTYTGQ